MNIFDTRHTTVFDLFDCSLFGLKLQLVVRPCSKAVAPKHLQSTTNLENFLEIMGQKYDGQKGTTIVAMAQETCK